MELHLFDKNLNFLGIIDDFKSLIWNRKFYETGNFELHLDATERNIGLIKVTNIIARKDSVEAGEIQSYIINSEDNTVVVYGEFLSTKLKTRIVPKTVIFKGTVETGMRTVINACTQIPNLTLNANVGYTERVEFQVTYDNLHDYISSLSISSGIGFRVAPSFADKKFIFSTYKGIDHSVTQNKNDHVAFSDDFYNLSDASYTKSIKDIANYAIIGGEGEGANRIVTVVDISNGAEKHEIFVDAKNEKQDELSMLEYLTILQQKGLEELYKRQLAESFECTLLNAKFEYKKHWDLGDTVSIYKKNWGLLLNQQIDEVQEIYENGNISILPTIGNPIN